MASPPDLLQEESVQQLIEAHQGARQRLERAAKLLADADQPRRAFEHVASALIANELRVFFSYKRKDAEAAKTVVKLLRKYSASKLQISYMDDFIREDAGRKYRARIREEIERANWFILLLPDQSDGRDWCLYETGLFERQMTAADRLVCLHHPQTELPSVIEDFQAVEASVPAVRDFLELVFVKPDPVPGMDAINPAVEEDLDRLANEIVMAVSPPGMTHKRFFGPWVSLAVPGAASMENRDDFDEARVLEANDDALKMFDLLGAPQTWGEMRRFIDEEGGDDRWREELFRVVRKIAGKRRFKPIQAVFSSHGKLYRPTVVAIDQREVDSAPHAYHVNFVEEVGGFDISGMPHNLSVLVTLLSMAFKFRWEILEPFAGRELAVEDLERISNALERMEQNAASRGRLDPESILGLFNEEQAATIGEMFGQWAHLRDRESDEGVLDRAIRDEDCAKVSELLDGLVPLNREFLALTAGRFVDSIQRRN